MRFLPWLILALIAARLCADDAQDRLDRLDESGGVVGLFTHSQQAPAAPQLDPKRIINQSNSLLKDREPDMTAEESATYDKLSAMLSTNPTLAVHMLETMVQDQEPPSPAFDVVLGNAYFAANQFDRAEALYRTALKRYPDFLRAWSDLGILCYSAGRYAEATANFSQAISLGAHEASTFGLLGYSLEKQGDFVAAEMAYLQAVASDPANPDWKEGLLRIYISERQFGRAEPLARAVLKGDPSSAVHWYDYAGILMAEGRKPEATVILDEAVQAGAAGPDELELLGDLYAEQGLAEEAASAYRLLLAAAPERGERKLVQFAHALVGAGRLDEAERLLEQAPDVPGRSADLEWLRARADLRMAQKRWPQARREIEALLAQAPLDGPALLVLGRTYLEEGAWPRAELSFEAAARIPASAYQADLELANLELHNRHFAQSAACLQKALDIQRTDTIETAYAHIKALASPDADSE